MKFEGIIIDDIDEWIEEDDGSFVVAIDREITIGNSRTELLNRLRAKGCNFVDGSADDGKVEVHYVYAKNPRYPNGEDVWFYLSADDANDARDSLSRRYPNLVGWRTEVHRITCQDLQTISQGKFDKDR
jgi:hypothetical protein